MRKYPGREQDAASGRWLDGVTSLHDAFVTHRVRPVVEGRLEARAGRRRDRTVTRAIVRHLRCVILLVTVERVVCLIVSARLAIIQPLLLGRSVLLVVVACRVVGCVGLCLQVFGRCWGMVAACPL